MRRHAVRIAVALSCVAAWQLTRLPEPSSAEPAAPFRFTAQAVNAPDRPGDRRVRTVAGPYEHISAWISSVGAGAGLFSMDGGPARDLCLVDPRTDTVTVSRVTGGGYRPFTLRPATAMPATAPMGCVPADLNEDGAQDVLVYYWGRSPVVFLGKAGTTSFAPRELVSPPQVWNTNAATIGDYDGDGHVDLVFGNYFPDGSKVLDPSATDVVMTSSLSNAYNGGTNRLYRSVGGWFAEARGAFTDKATGWTLALGTQDLNADGLGDLYVANDFGPDQLLINESKPGKVAFREVTGVRHPATPKSKVVGRDSFKGMGVAFASLNGDAVPDILVSNITEPFALHESNFAFVSGDGSWDDHSEDLGLSRTGWSWDVKAADFDNDGSQEVMHATGFVRGEVDRWAQLQEAATSNDLILSHPALWPNVRPGDDLSGHDTNSFFTRSAPGGRFVDVARQAGVGTDAVSRGFALGDVDADGRLDFVVANQWGQSTLYRNASKAGPSVTLSLRVPASCGAQATRPAIGAAVTLGGLQQQLYPANGHGGVSAPELTFGTAGGQAKLSWRDACGTLRTGTVTLAPGRHALLLTDHIKEA
ncbi:FG-GAP repeat domain-containing protein [Nonomuraea sp. NPDC050556]|uniref:FG-GAP repeat domain-containing protein n=1 Tax=Nonomuraea sp. NPDC050556 TaxID=3364369 RepID=UPI0037962015